MVNLVASDEANGNAQRAALLARTPNENNRQSFVERLNSESKNEQSFSWAARIGQRQNRPRISQMQFDSKGFSWVTYLEAEAQQRQKPIELAIRRVINENHREMVGAEKPDQATPILRPMFGKGATRFTEKYLKSRSEPKSLIGALLN